MDDIQAIFFEECAEGLTAAEQGLSAMGAGDASRDTIAAVFRAVHSIKGGAGAFGHDALTTFAHRFENLMDEVRAERIPVTDAVSEVLLRAFDTLSDHVAAAQDRASPPDDTAVLDALQRILDDAASGSAATPAPASPAPAPAALDSLFGEADQFGFSPVTVSLDDFDAPAVPVSAAPAPALPALPAAPAACGVGEPFEPCWTVLFRPSRAAMANGGEPLLVVRELESMGGQVVAVDWSALPPLRDLDPEESYIAWTIEVPRTVSEAAILDCFDFMPPDCVIEIEASAGAAPAAVPVVAAPPAPPAALAPLAPVAAIAAATAVAPVAAKPATTEPTTETATVEAASQTIRVDLPKLDLLLNLVGELVIRGSILADRLSPKDQEQVELPALARLTREIQDSVMSLRAQPIKQAFSRVPRMLRDLAAATGKSVRLETVGETTEVDKGVIEKIGEPLTHLIRNAVDHGIEDTEQRVAAGKPVEGLIRVSAEQRGARIFVRVSDDGRGIDRARVRAKAIERGIVSPDAVLSDDEIDQLICAPGFSTAESVSAISGRGVGLDVVRSNVESLGGRVEISSVPGRGTTFTLVLPLTLAILDGMIVRLGGQRFVLPLANVVEAVQPEPGQVRPTTMSNEVLELRGAYLPVRRLAETFGLPANDRRAPEDSLVIVVESETAGRIGLMVDTIDDRREVVIKSLDKNLHPISGLGGATILGDGSIALILDVEALVADGRSGARTVNRGVAA